MLKRKSDQELAMPRPASPQAPYIPQKNGLVPKLRHAFR